MYRIEQPAYFYLFIGLGLMVVFFIAVLWWKKSIQKQFAKSTMFRRLAPDYSPFKLSVKAVFLGLGIAFLILGLSNPKIGTKLKTMKREGVDIVFALDVSRSMDARDIAPSRLEKAKLLMKLLMQ